MCVWLSTEHHGVDHTLLEEGCFKDEPPSCLFTNSGNEGDGSAGKALIAQTLDLTDHRLCTNRKWKLL